jgi:hypothetical protein
MEDHTMTSSRWFWYFLMTGAIFLFAIAYGIGYMVFSDTVYAAVLPAALLALHVSEIPAARKAADGKNISGGSVIIKTTLFGFTWWLPLKKGILHK